MEAASVFILLIAAAVFVLIQLYNLRSQFYTDPCGKRCWVKIESGSTTVWVKGTVEDQSEHVGNLYFVLTDRQLTYVADITELKPIYFEL